jgi:hypothetical protein
MKRFSVALLLIACRDYSYLGFLKLGFSLTSAPPPFSSMNATLVDARRFG